MRGIFIDNGASSLRELPDAGREGECRVRVRLAGICGTDLQILDGYAGFTGVPGHEFVGIVEYAADERWIGRRVIGEINVGCGACAWCAAGIKEHCPDRTVLGIRGRNGAFAEHLWLPAVNLHEVPAAVDDVAATFTEPTAAACQILAQVDVRPDARTAVLGDGRMGLIVAQVLKTSGASVTVFGKHEHKLAVARRLGVDVTASADPLRPGDRFDLVVEVTGRPAGLARALEIVRPRGVIVLKSTFHGEAGPNLWPAIVNEVKLVGSRCGPFRPALDLIARGEVQVAPLVSRVCVLDEFDRAIRAAREELKVLLRP